MDKFSNDFSSKSYEDLLDEYAGESITSKASTRHEQPKAEAPKPQKREFTDDFSKSSPTPVRNKPVIVQLTSAKLTLEKLKALTKKSI